MVSLSQNKGMIPMKNKGVMISLAAIVLIGMVITTGTHKFIEKNSSPSAAAAQTGETDNGAWAGEAGAAQEAEEAVPQVLAAAAADEGTAAYAGAGMSGGEGREASSRTSGGAEAGKKEEAGYMISRTAAFSEDADSGVAAQAAGRSVADEAEMQETDVLSPLEPGGVLAEASPALEEAAAESRSYYVKRLQDLDSQIQKTRETQGSANGGNSAKSAASNELKLWDSELNAIYNAILGRLEQEQSEALVKEERAWLKERDSLAMEAAQKTAGGSGESLEYTLSLTESTRQRAYELAERYAWVLEE